jgi:hypothetical protein
MRKQAGMRTEVLKPSDVPKREGMLFISFIVPLLIGLIFGCARNKTLNKTVLPHDPQYKGGC